MTMKKALFLSMLLVSDVVLAQNTEIRYNQVGCSTQQEKVIEVEGINPAGKVRVTMPDGKTMKPQVQVRKALSPWSGKTRYVVDLGELTAIGNYHVNVGDATCDLVVN